MRNTKELLRKAQMPLMIAFGTVPALLLVFAFYAEELLPYGWLISGAYVLLSVLGFMIPGKYRGIYGIAAAVLSVASCWILSPDSCRIIAVSAGIVYSILMYWSLGIAAWSPEDELSPFWFGLGLGLHLLCQLILLMNTSRNNSAVDATAPSLKLAFFLFILLTMLSMNRGTLSMASSKRQTVSAGMRGKNLLMTLSVFAIAMLVTLIPSAVDVIKNGVFWIIRMIWKLIQLLTPRIKDVAAGESGGDPAVGGGLPSGGETSLFVEILTYVVLALCAIVFLVFLVLWLRWLLRRIVSLLRQLFALLSKYAAAASDDYEDEVTDTREEVNPEFFRPERKKRRTPKVDESTLTPAQRIRYRYLRLTGKHPEWTAASTARENLPVELAGLYEQARYSDHPVSREESDRFAEQTRKI